MKKIIFIFLILLAFMIGINKGMEEKESKADLIQEKIKELEKRKETLKENSEEINPSIINLLANKCNKGVDKIINKIKNFIGLKTFTNKMQYCLFNNCIIIQKKV